MTCVRVRRNAETWTHMGEMDPHRGKDGNFAATSPTMPRIAVNPQKLEEARKDSSPEPVEGD